MLSEDDGKKLLKLARQSVKDYIKRNFRIKETKFKEKQGVFVTIKNDGKLRGCIGYPYPELPLGEAVQRSAISAAFEDTRFPPLTPEELNQITFEISVLTKPELIRVKTPKDYIGKIKIGKDGLIVKFGVRSGLLLPQIAVENKLGAEEFLKHTCYKAGLTPDLLVDEGIKVYKFQAQIFSEDKSK